MPATAVKLENTSSSISKNTSTTSSSNAKKSGRKPIDQEAKDRRTAQNRAAQRAFRERREQKLKELHDKINYLENSNNSYKNESIFLRDQLRFLLIELNNFKNNSNNTSKNLDSKLKLYLNKYGGLNFENLDNNNNTNVISSNSSPLSTTNSHPSSLTSFQSSTKDTNTTITTNNNFSLNLDDLLDTQSLNNLVSSESTPNFGQLMMFGNSPLNFSLENSNDSNKINDNNSNNNTPNSTSSSNNLWSDVINAITPPNDDIPFIDTKLAFDDKQIISDTFNNNNNNTDDFFNYLNDNDISNDLLNDNSDNILNDNSNNILNDLINETPKDEFNTKTPQQEEKENEVIEIKEEEEEKKKPKEDFIQCSEVWERITSHPKYSNLDIDSLCTELMHKAKCSEKGVVVQANDVQKALSKHIV